MGVGRGPASSGAPQASVVWVDTDGEHVIFNTAEGRVKPNNMRRDARVAVAVCGMENPYEQAMIRNPALQVQVENGYYDLATPYYATEHTFDHLGLEPELRGNVTMAYYEAGHMMYIHVPSLAKLKADIAVFLGGAIPDRG